MRRRALARFETPDVLAGFVLGRALALLPPDLARAEISLTVLDPTCGSGALLAPAARHGLRVFGVDLDPAAAREAARRLGTVPGRRVKAGNALLDPVGPRDWPEFIAGNRDLLVRLADLRAGERFEEADVLAQPMRDRLAARLPAVLRNQGPFCWPLEFPEVFVDGGGFDVVVTNPPWDKLKLHVRECFDAGLRRLHESDQRRARSAALSGENVREAVDAHKQAIGAFRQWVRGLREPAASGRGGPRGDANAYLAVLDLAHDLLRPGGALGAIVPGGLWTDLSALTWRERLFAEYRGVGTWCFEARTDAFPAIDQRTAVVIGCKDTRPSREPGASQPLETGERPSITVHPALSCLADLAARPGFAVPLALIRRTAPESLAVPPLADALDAAIVEKLYLAGPPFAGGRWNPEFGREIDMTLDADLFDGVVPAGPGSPTVSPLWEGKRIGAFELCPVDAVNTGEWPGCKAACSRAASCPFERRNGHQLWLDESRLLARQADRHDHRGHARHTRVAWRSVARADRARRLEAALVPAGYRLGNSLNYLVGDRHTQDEKLTILALLNSLVVEWRFRQLSNNNNVNLFAIRQLPMPEGADPTLAEPAGLLMFGTPGVPDSPGAQAARLAARHALEAAVAHRFGLSAPELARILSGFPKLPPAYKAAVIEAFGNEKASGSPALGRAR